MNFQTIPPVPSAKDLLNLAFQKAREKGREKKLKGNWQEIIRKKEGMKLDIVKDILCSRLEKILQTFPEEKKLPSFYVKLIPLTLEYKKLKQSFGAIHWAIGKIRSFHREYMRRMSTVGEWRAVNGIVRQYYGRISSIIRQISPNLEYLEHARKIMRSYPDIKEMFTVCIYGFPNVGKTTLLNRLTGTSAKTAPYSFTTISINAGYATIKGKKIQFLDVPGTLARKEKMNTIELQAELVMKELADMIIYVFDLSGHSGYLVKRQEELFEKLKGKNTLVYIAKKDLTGKNELQEFAYGHDDLESVRKKIVSFYDRVAAHTLTASLYKAEQHI